MSLRAASAALASVRSVSLPAPLGPTTSTSRPLPALVPGFVGAPALDASDDTTALPPHLSHHRHSVGEVDMHQVGPPTDRQDAAIVKPHGPGRRRCYSDQSLRQGYAGNAPRQLE